MKARTKIGIRRAISALLLAAILLTPCAAAQEESGTLLALGDSITYGYGLQDIGSQRYAQLLADALGLKLEMRAVNGYTSEDVLRQLRESDLEAASEADIVCMSVGGNELLGPFFEALTALLPEGKTLLTATSNELMSAAFTLVDSPVKNAELKAAVRENLAKFKENFNEIISIIKEANPGCRIVVQTLYNPLAGGGAMLASFAESYKFAFDGINRVIRTCPDIVVCDVAAAIAEDPAGLTNIAQTDVHPNAAGHALIAQLMQSSLKADEILKSASPHIAAALAVRAMRVLCAACGK